MFGLALFFVPQFLFSAGGLPVNRIPPSFSNLRQMNRNSGFIFDRIRPNRVVGRTSSRIDTVPTVQITFRVERAIRGTRSGQVLTIREWAGLGSSGERYRKGERLLLFLYTLSKLGLTSSVGGSTRPLRRGLRRKRESGKWMACCPLADTVPQRPLRGRALVNSRAFALAIERSGTQRSATPRAVTQRTAAPNLAAE
jgi:hypothetical protein